MVVDATVSFENSDPLQLALLDAEVFKQASSIAEQDRHQVDLELVEDPEVRARWAMLAPWTSTFLSPAACLASRTAASRSLT